MIPPKPESRPDKVSLLAYLKLFRRDILSAQPQRLYRAWMAEFRTPFFRSFLVNQPSLVRRVLQEQATDFPKSNRVGEGLRPLLGNSVFLTNGAMWERQRRIIDPAFEGGKLRDSFSAIQAAARAASERIQAHDIPELLEIEEITSHTAADVIFRTLFSIPIEDVVASQVFAEFREFQRTQPILNLAAFIPLPKWMPRFHRRATMQHARSIRALITKLTAKRQAEIKDGTAPADLATKIMQTQDPLTGETFSTEEMVDQVAIFFLAGHETSASALAWALYLLAWDEDVQNRVAEEVASIDPCQMKFSELSNLGFTRDVFRETLRLYPPVPMMVREADKPQIFRDRNVPKAAQVVISPWHLHRHSRIWDRPDEFDPDRWKTTAGRACAREAYIPFSAGRRVCTGAGFAMVEGVVLLAAFVKKFRFEILPDQPPIPEAHLTVRSKNGIWLKVTPRDTP